MTLQTTTELIGSVILGALIVAIPILTTLAIIYDWMVAPLLLIATIGEFLIISIIIYMCV